MGISNIPPARARRVALFPWGGVIEDFLTPIGIDRRAFAAEMSGGWLFGYAEALRRVDVGTTIFCFSREVAAPERRVNAATGVATLFLPPSPLYRRLRRWPGDTDDPGRRRADRWQWAQDLARYAATPAGPVAAALRGEGCTAILAQEYESPRFDRLVALGRRIGLPVFGTFQGAPAASTSLEKRIRRRSLRAAAGLVVASSTEAARLERDYRLPPARIARIPNPLDLALWRPEPRAACRASLGLPQNALIAVCHGRIELHRKGLDLLIDAWRGIAAAHPERDLRLHLIGSGADDERLAAMVANEPVPGLRWVRRYVTDRAKMRRELAAADLYVLPSRHEGFPVAPLEAMACGLPVVAAEAPGVSDILEDGEASGGIRVPTGDAAALRSALERLLLDSHFRAQLARRARPRVAAFASLDAVGERISAIMHFCKAAAQQR